LRPERHEAKTTASMLRTPPLPPELWDQIPPAVQAVLGVIIEGYERRVAA